METMTDIYSGLSGTARADCWKCFRQLSMAVIYEKKGVLFEHSAELKSFFAKNERKVYIVGANIVDYVRCACICAAAENIVHYQQKGRFSDRVVACISAQHYA